MEEVDMAKAFADAEKAFKEFKRASVLAQARAKLNQTPRHRKSKHKKHVSDKEREKQIKRRKAQKQARKTNR